MKTLTVVHRPDRGCAQCPFSYASWNNDRHYCFPLASDSDDSAGVIPRWSMATSLEPRDDVEAPDWCPLRGDGTVAVVGAHPGEPGSDGD